MALETRTTSVQSFYAFFADVTYYENTKGRVLGVTVQNLGKLGAPGISLGILSNRVVNRWNVLDQRTVDAPSLNAFKKSLSRIRDNRMGFFMDYVR